MKYFVAVFALICAFQATQALDLEKCVAIFLEHADAALAKVDGYQQWRDEVTKIAAEQNVKLANCAKLAENDPPSILDNIRITACRTDVRRVFIADMQKMATKLANLGGEAIDLARQFPGEMLKCLGN